MNASAVATERSNSPMQGEVIDVGWSAAAPDGDAVPMPMFPPGREEHIESEVISDAEYILFLEISPWFQNGLLHGRFVPCSSCQ